jgi:hypothetical protein
VLWVVGAERLTPQGSLHGIDASAQ